MKILFLLILSSVSFAGEDESGCLEQAASIDKKLSCLTSLTFKEIVEPRPEAGMRYFEIQFKQWIDHKNRSLGQFNQRLILIHRSETEPMVLQTSGYLIFGVRLTAVANLFGTNQLQVEHRHFASSRPEKRDWTKLDIEQSAHDFHAITTQFKKIYQKRWVNTGASKGGMTSIYHRRFFPNDVDGTIADVAPLSFTTSDQRYVDFVNHVGGDGYRTCRDSLKRLQIELFLNREAIVPTLAGSFDHLGGADVAFEHSVIEMPYYFWQYGNPEDAKSGCSAIPFNGSVREKAEFLQAHAAIEDYTDGKIAEFVPYFYQAATQLGNPGNVTSHLERYRRHPFTIDQYTPKSASYTYSNAAMVDVDQWVRKSADKVLFIYGEFDPWTAGEFPLSETGKEVRKYFAPRGNHGAKFTMLEASQKAEATELISIWLAKKPVLQVQALETLETLEDLEFEYRRAHRL